MRVELYGPSDEAALIRFFDRDDQGFCFCRYWSFAGSNPAWLEVDPRDNRAAAQAEGGRMGVVAEVGEEIVGWMRIASTDSVPKLLALGLERGPVPSAASLLCMSVAAERRGEGLARAMLERAIEGLPSLGFTELRAYPRPIDSAEAGHVWTGPRALFVGRGFELVREAEPRCTLRRPFD